MNNPLLDREFLTKLDAQHTRVTRAKLISLNLNEDPIEEITGRITGGTINIDGNSAVRRTCSLSLVTDKNSKLTDYYWVLKTKFKVFLGLENNVDLEKYPETIWFPMGIFLINQFSCSHTANNLTIQISGKDKMSLLNGDMGGLFPGSVDLGTKEEIAATYDQGFPNNNTDKNKLYCDTINRIYYKWDKEQEKWEVASPEDYVYNRESLNIKDILLYMLRTFGGENVNNLIISDLDEQGIELLTYRADNKPLYYLGEAKNGGEEIYQPIIEQEHIVRIPLTIFHDNFYAVLSQKSLLDYWTFLDYPREGSGQFLWVKQIFIPTEYYYWKIQLQHLENARNYVLWANGLEEAQYVSYEDNDEIIFIDKNGSATATTIDTSGLHRVAKLDNFKFDQSTNLLGNTVERGTKCKHEIDESEYYITRIQSGETVGYRTTSLTYPGDLIASAGESISSILDKIVKTLGDFEYFYDVNGKFIFQKKKTYINSSWNPLNQETNNVEFVVDNTRLMYNFKDNELLISASNAPSINNLKNDFSVWGTRKTSSGAEIPIHMRYAIHKKPIYYKNYYGNIYYTTEYATKVNNGGDMSIEYHVINPATDQIAGDTISLDDYKPVDWREIIYQMAIDYQNNNQYLDFSYILIRNNQYFYPTGNTGYEQFYEDMVGFWRDIYNPDPTEDDEHIFNKGIEQGDYFNIDVYQLPQNLSFWLDFLPANSTLGKYSVLNVGDRPKIANDNTVKAIYYTEPPAVMFYTPSTEKNVEQYENFVVRTNVNGINEYFMVALDENFDPFMVRSEVENEIDNRKEIGYKYFQLPKMYESLFVTSSQGKSAKDQIDQWLYNYANVTEAVNLTTIPIYYLDTNTLISLNNSDNHIEGEYIINKLTYNLTYNGNMSLSASKVVRRLY